MSAFIDDMYDPMPMSDYRHLAASVRSLRRRLRQASPPANVAATVNSRPITYSEVERTYKSQFLAQGEGDQRRPDVNSRSSKSCAR